MYPARENSNNVLPVSAMSSTIRVLSGLSGFSEKEISRRCDNVTASVRPPRGGPKIFLKLCWAVSNAAFFASCSNCCQL